MNGLYVKHENIDNMIKLLEKCKMSSACGLWLWSDIEKHINPFVEEV